MYIDSKSHVQKTTKKQQHSNQFKKKNKKLKARLYYLKKKYLTLHILTAQMK